MESKEKRKGESKIDREKERGERGRVEGNAPFMSVYIVHASLLSLLPPNSFFELRLEKLSVFFFIKCVT